MTPFLLALLAGAARAGEPGTEAATFLTTDASARTAAMGGTGTASAGGTGWLFYNPAGIALEEKFHASASHLEIFGGENFEILGFTAPLGTRMGMGLSVEYVHSEDSVRDEFDNFSSFTNSDLGVGLSLGYALSDRLAVGATAKFIQERLFTFEATARAVDLGLLYRPTDRLTLGASLLHWGEKIRFIRDEDPLPIRYRGAAAYRWRTVQAAYDLIATDGADPSHALGLEWAIVDDILLRGGYRLNHDGRGADGPTAGIGARLSGLELRYAFAPRTDEVNDHRLEATLAWGARRAPGTLVSGPARPARGRPRPEREIARARRTSKFTLPLEMTGSATTSLRYIDIDNPGIIGKPRAFSNVTDWTFLGSTDAYDFTFSGQATNDRWDGTELRRGTILFRAPRITAQIGDFLAEMTPYTVTPQTLRGGRVAIERPAPPPPAAASPDAGRVRAGRLSVGRWYRETARDPRFVRNTSLTTFGGRAERSVGRGSRVPFQNGRLASLGTFERFTYGMSLREALNVGNLGIHMALSGDDPASISDAGSAKPLRSTTFALTLRRTLANGRTAIEAEHAYSRSFRDRRLTSSKENDLATIVRVRNNAGNPDHSWEIALERIGAGYEAVGSPLTRSLQDRVGPRARWNRTLVRIGKVAVISRLHAETRRDNLDDRDPFTTQSSLGGGALELRFPNGIRTVLGGNFQRDLSDESRDTLATIGHLDRRTSDRRVDIVLPFGAWNVNAGLGRTRLDDRSRYNLGTASSFTLTTTRVGASGTIGRSNLSANWIRSLSFFRSTGTASKTDFLFGRAGFEWIPGKFTSALSTQYARSEGATQKEIRYDIGGQVQVNLSSERSIGLEIHRFKDQFTPSLRSLDYLGTDASVRWTEIF